MSAATFTPARAELAAWLVLFGALLVGIGIESDWGRRWVWPVELATVTPAPFDNPRLSAPFALSAPDAFLETALRPLFVSTRRPAPIPPPQEKRQSMKKGQFILTGTTIVGEAKFAHLVERANNKSHVVAEGGKINGLLIKEVGSDRVVLSLDEETESIVLQVAKTPPPPPQKEPRK